MNININPKLLNRKINLQEDLEFEIVLANQDPDTILMFGIIYYGFDIVS